MPGLAWTQLQTFATAAGTMFLNGESFLLACCQKLQNPTGSATLRCSFCTSGDEDEQSAAEAKVAAARMAEKGARRCILR